MNTNQLSNEAKKVLMAIFQDGAKEGQVHFTSIGKITRILNWDVSQTSSDKIRGILHDLLTNGYSVKIGDTSATGSYLSAYEVNVNGSFQVTINIPENLAKTL